jgi:hypothetical protein
MNGPFAHSTPFLFAIKERLDDSLEAPEHHEGRFDPLARRYIFLVEGKIDPSRRTRAIVLAHRVHTGWVAKVGMI